MTTAAMQLELIVPLESFVWDFSPNFPLCILGISHYTLKGMTLLLEIIGLNSK